MTRIKKCVKNHLWETAGQLLRETEKLVSGDTATAGKNVIDFQDVKTTSLHNRDYQYATAKVHVFSDSVLCFGKMVDDLVEAWKRQISMVFGQQFFQRFESKNGQPVEFEWKILPILTPHQQLDSFQSSKFGDIRCICDQRFDLTQELNRHCRALGALRKCACSPFPC